MEQTNNEEIIFECKGSFILSENDDETSKGNAQIKLQKENILILSEFKEPMFFSYRDVLSFYGEDYKIILNLPLSEKLIIYDLGYKYEDFLRIFAGLRNEVIIKDLLMYETLKKTGIDCEFVFKTKEETRKGKCELRLYETGIVILPENIDIIRVPYSDIKDIKTEDYKIIIVTEYEEEFIFSMFGKKYDSVVKALSESLNELSLKVQQSIKELITELEPAILRKISVIMKEGKAAKRKDIIKISENVWAELEKKIEILGIKEEYDFLKSMAQENNVCIGLKRGLLGDLTGEYLWFLIPIYSLEHNKPGNAIAMEATSDEGSGKATYFFRITGRNEYGKLKNIDDLHKEVDNFIKKINRCMLAINFRREPIYLPEEKLNEPNFAKYQYPIARIKELRELRQLFIGRVIHSTFDKWQNDVMDLLKFNITERDNNKKWKKN